jgi:hypothetical protein
MNKKNIVIGILIAALIAAVGINFYTDSSQGVSIDGTEIITINPSDHAFFSDNSVDITKTVGDITEQDCYYFKKSDYELLFNKSYIAVPDGGCIYPETLETFQIKVKENKGKQYEFNSTDGRKVIDKYYDVKEVL